MTISFKGKKLQIWNWNAIAAIVKSKLTTFVTDVLIQEITYIEPVW